MEHKNDRWFLLGAAWARWVDRNPRAILLGSLVVSLVGALLAARLPVQADLAHLLPPGAASVRQLRALEQRAQVFGTVLVAIESDDPASRLKAAQLIRQRAEALGPERVINVWYDDAAARAFAWRHRLLFAPLEDLEMVRASLAREKAKANPLFVSLDEPEQATPVREQLQTIKQRLDEARQRAERPTPLVSKDGRLQLVVIRTRSAAGEMARNGPVLAALRAAASEAEAQSGGQVAVGLTGDVVTAVAEQSSLISGMLQATGFTVLVVGAGLLVFFRSGVGVAALLGSLAVGALATFGFARVAVGHLNLATAFLSSIVVGNGINFGIILLARYLEERRREPDPVEALAAALRGSFEGTLAAALTAAVAYGSLVTTSFRGFRHFGVIGGVGIFLCWVAAYTVLPAALLLLDRSARFRLRPTEAGGRWLARLVPRHPLVVAATLIVMVFGAALGAWRYVASDPLETNFQNLRSVGPDIQAATRWMEKLDREFGRGISGGIVLAAPDRQTARELLATLRAHAQGKTEGQRLFARLRALDDVMPANQAEKLEALGVIRGLLTESVLAALDPADRALAEELRPPPDLRPIAEAEVPTDLAWPFTETDGTRGRLLLATVGAGFNLWDTRQMERFMTGFQQLKLGPEILVGGVAFVQHDIVQSLYHDGPRATVVAILGALLVVLLVVGVNRHTLVTLICGVSGTLLLLAAAWLLRLRVNFLDFVALPITIGIGIDYSVNLVTRHRRERPAHTRELVATTGAAVLVCSMTTVIGYGSLLFSPNQGVRSFGIAAFIGELTCIASALALAPALLELGRRRPQRGA